MARTATKRLVTILWIVSLLSFAGHAQLHNYRFNPHHRMVERTVGRMHSLAIAVDTGSNSAPSGETPGSIACIYGLAPDIGGGCKIAIATTLPRGGSGTIYIIGSFDYPQAEVDLNVFSTQFGLPSCTEANGCFHKVYATGVRPDADCGWSVEMSLDTQWAHAMAPRAKIVLIESATDSDEDQFQAIQMANDLVDSSNQAGRAFVSMSFADYETPANVSHDYLFQHEGVVYIAGAGDSGAANSFNVIAYPATSPYVIAAGGTSIVRDSLGNFLGETTWATTQHCNASGKCFPGCNRVQLQNGECVGGGGGLSALETRPFYQDEVANVVGNHRGTPDFSAVGDPNTGVSIFDSFACQGYVNWQVLGGTSVSAPLLAGFMSSAASHRTSSGDELNPLYNSLGGGYFSIFRDILLGTDGSFIATPGYDLTTGLGAPRGLKGF